MMPHTPKPRTHRPCIDQMKSAAHIRGGVVIVGLTRGMESLITAAALGQVARQFIAPKIG